MEDELRTAHARTDIEATPEGIQSDLDIMIAYGIKKGEFYCFKLFMVKRLSNF